MSETGSDERPLINEFGAGPGDADLLTLRAVRAIGAADVLLVDDLVNPDVLRHARASALRVTGLPWQQDGEDGHRGESAAAVRVASRRGSTDVTRRPPNRSPPAPGSRRR